jgi:apolipoprotein D and lipocalin family protein
MKFLAIVISLWTVLSLANGQGTRCFDVKPLPDFDPTTYLGVWYEIERVDYLFEAGLKCVKAEYGQLNSTAISVKNTGVNENSGEPSLVEGYAFIPNSAEPNKLVVRLPIISNGVVIENSGDYQIIDTDGKTYSLVYSCSKLGALKIFDVVWILSREKTLSKEIIDMLKAKTAALGINNERLKPIAQDC